MDLRTTIYGLVAFSTIVLRLDAASAADADRYREQAETWCHWMGVSETSKTRGGDDALWFGCNQTDASQGITPLPRVQEGQHLQNQARPDFRHLPRK
jgi:hypothetical protein